MGRRMTKSDFFGVLFVQMRGVPKNQKKKKKCGATVISTQSDVNGVKRRRERGLLGPSPLFSILLWSTPFTYPYIIIPSPVSSFYHLLSIPHLIHT